MIDLHSHILPGLDDGAVSVEHGIELAIQSLEAGVTHMVCTPHINIGTFDNTAIRITEVFNSFTSILMNSGISLKLSLGAEVRVSADIITLIKRNELPYIGKWSGKDALLLELPHSHIPAGVEKLIMWLKAHQIQPIVPHPERNREIQSNYQKAIWLKNMGCLFQLTAGSLVGRFRSNILPLSLKMIENGLISYVASDLHNIDRRPNDMGEARETVIKTFGIKIAQQLFVDVPSVISSDKKWIGLA